MIWIVLTVICYALSSLGDKFIADKLRCKRTEFTFIVSTATAFWLGITLVFSGWQFEWTIKNILVVGFMIIWKILEFYTAATLLKTSSAYELKAWLGINIVLSYFVNVKRGVEALEIGVLIFSAVLFVGIYMIVSARKLNKKSIVLCLLYILSKLLYGLMPDMLSSECNTTSALLIVMVIIAVVHIPLISIREIVKKEGLKEAVATRIPNAIGLMTEIIAARQNVFLYAMVQPAQLALLFVVSVVKKENMNRKKKYGSILCIIAVIMITVLLQ